MPPIIEFDRVSVHIHEKTLLSDISFDLFAGEKAVLCGKSGSGKSSVLRALLGLLPLSQGMIRFQEKPLDAASVQAIRSRIAYIGQEPILGAESVREALLLPFQFKSHHGHKPTEAQIMDVLQRLHLPADILRQDSGRISGGEKQRIALARGLLLGKSIYLLDEVTSALDAASRQAVFEVFSDARLTVLSVAHDPVWIERCDLVFEIEEGRLTSRRGRAGFDASMDSSGLH
ncbi:ABC transporter ATP-binding protein [Methylobacter sp. YRD-M1]|uniref:ABC transporter ATP-binding protein n=1 Tax=Methylobacter sp. YRD-M1 TaxID=2911520 RepID=UPI00227A92F6|nr:ATP-binding cassette domain-containing protein [Methylobacter sp. YRD-M1]WAK02399.1 ATP-binding cassette domain-containing protein [Methylobacter sp. YRD-M1]